MMNCREARAHRHFLLDQGMSPDQASQALQHIQNGRVYFSDFEFQKRIKKRIFIHLKRLQLNTRTRKTLRTCLEQFS